MSIIFSSFLMRKTSINKTLKHIRFSPEFEFSCKNKIDMKKLIVKGWELDSDFSVVNGCEIRPKKTHKLYFNNKCLKEIKEVLDFIKKSGGKIYRQNTGLHVHIDTNLFTEEEVIHIFDSFIKLQAEIYKKFNVNKVRANIYTQKIDPKCYHYFDKRKLKKWLREPHTKCFYYRDRNYGLNLFALLEHDTIEFRFGNMDLDFKKVYKLIKFIINFVLKYSKKEA